MGRTEYITEYIAALDLGTSKMLSIAARKDGEGVLSILGSEKEISGNCIRRGCIYHVGETALKISSLINRMDRKLDANIKKVYVGLGGQSLRTEYHTVKKEMNGSMVDDRTIDSLYNDCLSYMPNLAEILEIVSPEYYLDGRPEADPRSLSCQTIEAKFLLILGRPSLKICLGKSIEEKARIEIAGFFISPLATAEAVLTKREKKLGCALIEFGAGITYLSVYKNGSLKYLIAIPLGSNIITKDICDLGMSEEEAEILKIREGSALIESEKGEQQLNNVIEGRATEIVANVIEHIKLSGYESSLGEGIVITGGGSLLRNLDELIHLKTGKLVRIACVNKSLVHWTNSWSDLIDDPASACIFGLLSLGKENCAKIVAKVNPEPVRVDIIDVKVAPPVEKKKKKKRSFREALANFSKGLFDEVKEEE